MMKTIFTNVLKIKWLINHRTRLQGIWCYEPDRRLLLRQKDLHPWKRQLWILDPEKQNRTKTSKHSVWTNDVLMLSGVGGWSRQWCHLVAVKGVDKASLQQVQYLHCTVTGTSDHEVVGRVIRKAVDCCFVDCFRWDRTMSEILLQHPHFEDV